MHGLNNGGIGQRAVTVERRSMTRTGGTKIRCSGILLYLIIDATVLPPDSPFAARLSDRRKGDTRQIAGQFFVIVPITHNFSGTGMCRCSHTCRYAAPGRQ